MTAVTAAAPMLIEQALPTFDAVRTEHLVVAGGPVVAYAAVLRAAFMRAWRESAAVRAQFGVRTLAERAMSAARGRRAEAGCADRLRRTPEHDRGKPATARGVGPDEAPAPRP